MNHDIIHIQVPVPSHDVNTVMQVIVRLGSEGTAFRVQLEAFLRGASTSTPFIPLASGPSNISSTGSGDEALEDAAYRVLRSSEPGRRAVVLTMAKNPGIEVSGADLMAAYATAPGVEKALPSQLSGLLGSLVRRLKAEKVAIPYYESYPGRNGGPLVYKMTMSLAKAFNEASKKL